MGKHDTRKPETHKRRLSPDARRRAMLDAGLRVFGAKAYEAVTLDELCAAAGVSRPLLQHYFGSKKGFFIAVVRHGIAAIEDATGRDAAERTAKDLGANMRQFFEFMRGHPAGATLVRGAGGVPEVAELIDAFRSRTVALVLEVLPQDPASLETQAAVHCWNGVNEKLIAQLIDHPDLSVAWAAQFSQNALMSLLSLAGLTSTQIE